LKTPRVAEKKDVIDRREIRTTVCRTAGVREKGIRRQEGKGFPIRSEARIFCRLRGNSKMLGC